MRISCLYSLGIWLAFACVKLNTTILTLHQLAMVIVGTKNKIRDVIAIQQNCMNRTSPFDSYG